jgi:hypothetical protein
MTTARLGLRTAVIVGLDATTVEAPELGLLRSAGVAIEAVAISQAPVFRNEETPRGRVQTLVSAAAPVPVSAIPGAWRDAMVWSLVPVADEVGDEWAAAIPPDVQVALGWQGLLRRLVPGEQVTRRPPRNSPLFARANLIGVSKQDLAPGTDSDELLAFLEPGTTLLLTDGLNGGDLISRDASGRLDSEAYRAIPAAGIVDPTGAGDVFLAAFLSVTIRPELAGPANTAARADLRFAAAAASIVVEGVGLAAVPRLDDVRIRLRDG